MTSTIPTISSRSFIPLLCPEHGLPSELWPPPELPHHFPVSPPSPPPPPERTCASHRETRGYGPLHSPFNPKQIRHYIQVM